MKKVKFIFCTIILIGLFSLGVLEMLLPQREYSEMENRMLETFKKGSISAILSGKYQEQLQEALSDQFIYRDRLVSLSTTIKKVLGRRDINDTYLGKDGYCFEKILDKDINLERYEKNLDRIKKLIEEYELDSNILLVPSSGVVLKEKLPTKAMIYDYAKLVEMEKEILGDKVVDCYELLRKADNQAYFYSDHHWTSYGAYLGYQALGYKGEYDVSLESDDFLGTLYSRVLDDKIKKDSIYLPKVDDVKVLIDGKESSLYDYSKLKEKDEYQVYLGGNHGIVEIYGMGEENLLIIKDSFANSLVPYLVKDYAKITMIDLRYYPGTIRGLLDKEEFAKLLVIYEMNNFSNDLDLTKLSLK